jgi:hypothetical protein
MKERSSPVAKTKTAPYDPYERNKDYYENEQALEDEFEQMARYLVDKPPNSENFNANDRFTDMMRKTKTERKAIQLREFTLKCQVELAILRCIRPDLM